MFPVPYARRLNVPGRYEEEIRGVCNRWRQFAAALKKKPTAGVPAKSVIRCLEMERFIDSPGILKKMLQERQKAIVVLTNQGYGKLPRVETILLKDVSDPYSKIIPTELQLARAGGEIYFVDKIKL